MCCVDSLSSSLRLSVLLAPDVDIIRTRNYMEAFSCERLSWIFGYLVFKIPRALVWMGPHDFLRNVGRHAHCDTNKHEYKYYWTREEARYRQKN